MIKFDALENYKKTEQAIGYIPRKKATLDDYKRIGFMSGLEVHQQLKTKEKLFCHCPAGIYQKPHDYDAEIIRHMRPTLSELGEYDGTALMEFKTRKEIVYQIKHQTACTYEIDDTPPFKIDREALEIALEIAMLCKLNIVGEVHITRKQYLDGSIPTGFQRTAILGVEGELDMPHKKIRLIQLSIEEDSCREVSDVGHRRVYMTDRLGMPLIETVTYPDMQYPDEVKEVADYIRFLNRSTGKVRIGIGAGRQDVNVSCKGGTRVEIKGVSHNKWIPELTHNEAFRQWALLHLRDELLKKVPDINNWKIESLEINPQFFDFNYTPLKNAIAQGHKLIAVKLPYFRGAMSHFTQPGRCFAHEISERLKVIACIEQPNMTHDEDWEKNVSDDIFEKTYKLLNVSENDAVLLFWSPVDDIPTALEVIQERCQMAFKGVPKETRKSLPSGITIFERVLPGADRMYPDTDSAPIPLANEYLEKIAEKLPVPINKRFQQLVEWKVPKDTYTYLLRNNLVPLIEKINIELGFNPIFVATLLAHRLKHLQGKAKNKSQFRFEQVYDLLAFIKQNQYTTQLAYPLLKEIYLHPEMDFQSILHSIKFQPKTKEEIMNAAQLLKNKFTPKKEKKKTLMSNWIMGVIRPQAIGNVELNEVYKLIEL
ncbi:MAG: Glu-tRNA(Gln) amidotransferase subunit GatE [Bacteroidales bacterium]|nr:Glu-tRNA(Gln) amidotransferase subunit GatE [Bacteroidales bacterium]